MGEIVGAPMESYSAEDQAFYRFWYGHMLNDLMQPPLANVDHATARYIWNAAIESALSQSTEQGERDAARYRWLRQQRDPWGWKVQAVWKKKSTVIQSECGERLDAAIDAAMSPHGDGVNYTRADGGEDGGSGVPEAHDRERAMPVRMRFGVRVSEGDAEYLSWFPIRPAGVMASFKVGDRVLFRGIEHEVFANGDRPGTFDICQPGWPAGTDRWLNVPPDQLSHVSVAGEVPRG